MHLVTALFLSIGEKITIKYARGLLVQLQCSLLCASGIVTINLSTLRVSDPSSWWKYFTMIWPNVCATAVLLACLSHFPFGPILWFILLLLEYLPIFKSSQRRQPLFKSKHPSHQHGVSSFSDPEISGRRGCQLKQMAWSGRCRLAFRVGRLLASVFGFLVSAAISCLG